MDILSKIKILQGAREWTDYRLAQEAGIPQATLATIFQRGTPPKIETLQCICNAFGLTLSQFFLEDESVEVLSAQEKEMLAVFRTLSPSRRRALIDAFTEYPPPRP